VHHLAEELPMKAIHAEAATATGVTGEQPFTIELMQLADYRFEAHFDDPSIPALVTDEPAPLGAGAGPNPARLLATAVANCLAASLLFAMRKFGNRPDPLRALATTTMARNERGRWRVARIGVDLHLGAIASDLKSLPRVLAQFEDFCIVTQSVRAAFPVDVRVFDHAGSMLAPAP
jgi:organic hydroperoxide reductase OsmC/OhrA